MVDSPGVRSLRTGKDAVTLGNRMVEKMGDAAARIEKRIRVRQVNRMDAHTPGCVK